MSRNNPESLPEFAQLVQQLNDKSNHPAAKRMPNAAKQTLRRDLLNQYDEHTLSPKGVWQLWRFAGSVAGVMLLAIAVIWFVMAISQSQSNSNVSSPVVVPTEIEAEMVVTAVSTPFPSPTSTPIPFTLNADLGDSMQLRGYAIIPESGFLIFETDESFQIDLFWETTGQPTANYMTYLHLLDENGTLLVQADYSLGETSILATGTQFSRNATLLLPFDISPGTYTINVGLYDSKTGQRSSQIELTQIEIQTDMIDVEPTANSIEQFRPNDNIWVISAKQLSRTATDEPVTFEITLGIDLDSSNEAILQLFYSNRAWQGESEGRWPTHRIGSDQVIYVNTEVITVTAVLDPIEMAANVETNIPILMTQLGTLSNENPLQSSFETSLLSTFNNVQFDLQSLESIEYHFDTP